MNRLWRTPHPQRCGFLLLIPCDGSQRRHTSRWLGCVRRAGIRLTKWYSSGEMAQAPQPSRLQVFASWRLFVLRCASMCLPSADVSFGDKLTLIRDFPLVVKLLAFALWVSAGWWLLWGTSGSKDPEPKASAAPATGTVINASVNAPHSTQINAPGATLNFNTPPSDAGLIPGTRFTYKEIEELFPFGWMIIFYKERRRIDEVDSRGELQWKADDVEAIPDFSKQVVRWKIKGSAVRLRPGNSLRLTSNQIEASYPMEIGKLFLNRDILIEGEIQPHMMTLSTNQRTPVFALGYKFPDPQTAAEKAKRLEADRREQQRLNEKMKGVRGLPPR